MEGQDGGPRREMKVHIIDRYVNQLKGEGKWTNTRLINEKLLQRFKSEEPLDCKELLSDGGCLNYVFDTYTIFRTFFERN